MKRLIVRLPDATLDDLRHIDLMNFNLVQLKELRRLIILMERYDRKHPGITAREAVELEAPAIARRASFRAEVPQERQRSNQKREREVQHESS